MNITCLDLLAIKCPRAFPDWWWVLPTAWIVWLDCLPQGLAPSGNRDPFAQRRAALGLSQSLVAKDLDFDLRLALSHAAKYLPVPAGADIQQAVLEFILERQRNAIFGERRAF